MDEVAQNRLNELVSEAFSGLQIGLDSTSHRWHQLRTAQTFDGEPRTIKARMRWYEQFPLIDTEGDGIRSFVGVSLALLVGRRPIVLIDEPEAFLHPPQARVLGRFIGREASQTGRQIFVATHSSDVLLGVLEEYAKAQVVRLSREREFVTKAVSGTSTLEISSDPVLHSSDVVDGLFHKAVAVVEGFSDRRFYAHVLSVHGPAFDVRVVTAQNKQTAYRLINFYRSAGVASIAILDFDIMHQESDMEKLMEYLQFSTEDVQNAKTLRRQVKESIEKTPTIDHALSVRSKLSELAGRINETAEDSDLENVGVAIRELSRTVGRWGLPKTRGLLGLQEDVQESAKTLLQMFQVYGVFIVPVGELESWSIPGMTETYRKSRWLSAALGRISQANTLPEMKPLTNFLNSCLHWLRGDLEASSREYGEACNTFMDPHRPDSD